MSAAFTPGPWSLHKYTDYVGRTTECEKFLMHSVAFGVGETLLGEVSAIEMLAEHNTGYPRVTDFDENKANAHLIAAAPDLYALLEACVLAVDDDVRENCPSANEIRAALKKARGEK